MLGEKSPRESSVQAPKAQLASKRGLVGLDPVQSAFILIYLQGWGFRRLPGPLARRTGVLLVLSALSVKSCAKIFTLFCAGLGSACKAGLSLSQHLPDFPCALKAPPVSSLDFSKEGQWCYLVVVLPMFCIGEQRFLTEVWGCWR